MNEGRLSGLTWHALLEKEHYNVVAMLLNSFHRQYVK